MFGLAFLGAMAFSGITVQGQGSVDPGGGEPKPPCYQRMVICNGHYTVKHCDNEFTSDRCSRYEFGCLNCQGY
ncbi:MAG: hypothetical protein ACQEW9_14310 [Bacteroidota bacterium]